VSYYIYTSIELYNVAAFFYSIVVVVQGAQIYVYQAQKHCILFLSVIRRVRKIAKSDYYLRPVRLSVPSSVRMEQLGYH
jgi:hypothetical protein